jgi:hypothetical protein
MRKLSLHDWVLKKRELEYYDKSTYPEAIHFLSLELNLFLSHLISIMQRESLVFIYSGQDSIVLQ